jgi:hypothetical protein
MSRVGSETRDVRTGQALAMSPARRMLLALELGDDDVALYSAVHGVDKEEARRILQRQRQSGRRSRCAQTD